MTAQRGRGYGKLILAGEHAVVYGAPAIAFAVDLYTEVTLLPHTGPLEADVDDRCREALTALLGPEGFRVEIDTSLPVGRGMGSSAALAVATVRAAGTQTDVYERAMVAERIFHGNPSGLDVAMAANGGVLRFQNGAHTPLPVPSWQVVVLDTGIAGDTRSLVAGVAARRPTIDPCLERIAALVDEAASALLSLDALGPLLSENHALLKQIGVSTPACDALVDLAMAHGAAGAKLSGAGGGGVVIALTNAPEPLVSAATGRGVRTWVCRPMRRPDTP